MMETLQSSISAVTTEVAAPCSAQISSSCARIGQLVLERELWQENAFKTSNEQLYELLAKCYQYYTAMSEDNAESKALRADLNDYIKLKAYKFSKSTHTLNKIVKCVFGIDRRRVSAYAIVLRAASEQKISLFDIADFIRNSGGVEEIRLQKSSSGMSRKQKAEQASSVVESSEICVVRSDALSEQLDAGKIGTNTVLIGTWQADGSIIVRSVVESESALCAALVAHYAASKSEITQAQSQLAEQIYSGVTRQAISDAAASATVTVTA